MSPKSKNVILIKKSKNFKKIQKLQKSQKNTFEPFWYHFWPFLVILEQKNFLWFFWVGWPYFTKSANPKIYLTRAPKFFFWGITTTHIYNISKVVRENRTLKWRSVSPYIADIISDNWFHDELTWFNVKNILLFHKDINYVT